MTPIFAWALNLMLIFTFIGAACILVMAIRSVVKG